MEEIFISHRDADLNDCTTDIESIKGSSSEINGADVDEFPGLARCNAFSDDQMEESDAIPSSDFDGPNNYVETEYESFSIVDSPNGSRYWIPKVPLNVKPVQNSVVSSLKEGRAIYERYAEMAGFETRLSTVKKYNGYITHRYILCNKAGKSTYRSKKSVDDEDGGITRRSSAFKVTNCKACVGFKAIPDSTSYRIHKFVEAHNHRLMDNDDMEFSKARRKIQYPEKRFINRMATSHIGPSSAYRLRALSSGGQRRVRGNVDDFRNYKRDLSAFIGTRDAQMLIDKLKKKSLNDPNFYFNYNCEKSELVTLFWADHVAKLHYKAFGDVLAFDATYRTNKYKMVFVPFTGVDHHQRSITFGGALIKREDIESYKFILEEFMKAHSTQPKLVLTDQDPAMKVAVEAIFYESAHHLCAWHIMNKLPIKIAGELLANTDVRKRIQKLVWNTHLTSSQFEERWKQIIQDFKLAKNTWLNKVYAIRSKWIPGYFSEIPMCCLMKTTSRAESSNSFFRRYMHPDNSLLEFMICFETAMDDQRYKQRKHDHETESKRPGMKTELPIERFAADVYTSEVFKAVQKQILKAVWFCDQKSVVTDGQCDEYVIVEKDRGYNVINEFKVVIKHLDKKIECSCNKFGRMGYFCSHIFSVFKFLGIQVIPDAYVLRRWRKDALPRDIHKIQQRGMTENDEKDELFTNAVSIVELCASRLRGDVGKMKSFVDKLKQMQIEICNEIPCEPEVNSNPEIFKTYLDASSPEKVEVTVPEGARNKGCGTNKRMIGPGEKVVAKIKKKNPRLCRMCNKYEFHDSRTCPMNPKNLNKKFKKKAKQQCSSSNDSEESS